MVESIFIKELMFRKYTQVTTDLSIANDVIFWWLVGLIFSYYYLLFNKRHKPYTYKSNITWYRVQLGS